MKRWCVGLALAMFLVVARFDLAADPAAPVGSANGKIIKVDKDLLTIQPRGDDGKFGKPIVLKLTGTSKFSMVTTREQAGKTVVVQKETQARDLQADQIIAVTYAILKEDKILLSGSIQTDK